MMAHLGVVGRNPQYYLVQWVAGFGAQVCEPRFNNGNEDIRVVLQVDDTY